LLGSFLDLALTQRGACTF